MLPVVLFETAKPSLKSVTGFGYTRIIEIVEQIRNGISDQRIGSLQLLVGIPPDWSAVVCVTVTPPFQELFPTMTPVLKILNP